MNVHLTPELERLVQSKVKSGRYSSASEVVGEALRLLDHRDELFTLHKEEIREQSLSMETKSSTASTPNLKPWSAPLVNEAVRSHQTGRPAERDLGKIKSYLGEKAGPETTRRVMKEIRRALDSRPQPRCLPETKPVQKHASTARIREQMKHNISLWSQSFA